MSGTVIAAGEGGRGFVIATEDARYVVTAAHCLPDLPPAHAANGITELTYARFIGPLGSSCEVWAECVFVDPVADLAVFASPGPQELYEAAAAYNALIDSATPFGLGRLQLSRQRFRIGDDWIEGNLEAASDARLLSLDGTWFDCRIKSIGGRVLWIENAAQPLRSGMSGSPILLPDGSVVGVFCVSGGAPGTDHREGEPNPVLAAGLPVWLAQGVVTKDRD